MKILLISALLMTSLHLKAQPPFEVINEIKEDSPYKEIFLKAYPLTLKELESLNMKTITETDYSEISLLINTLDFSSLDASHNNLILQILRKNKIIFIANIIEEIFIKTQPSEATIYGLADLYKKADQIKSLKFKQLLEKSSNQLFDWLVENMDKISPESVKEVKLLYGQLPNSETVASVSGILEYFGPKSARLFNEFVKNKRVLELSNSDVILPSIPLEKGIIHKPHLNGDYRLNTTCGADNRSLNQVLEITQGITSNCDPGDYSKGAHAAFAPFFKSERSMGLMMDSKIVPLTDINQNPNTLNFVIGYEMSATGGYACENYLGRPRNCRDYSSSSIGNLQVQLKIDKCTDIYSCHLINTLDNQSEKTSDNSKVSVSIDERNKTDNLIMRDEEHLLQISVKDDVKHNSGSGKASAKNYFYFQLYRPTYSQLSQGFEQPTYAESLNIWAWASILDREPSALNDTIDRLQQLKKFSASGEVQKATEVSSLYSLLLFIRNYKSSFSNPLVARALNILNQNASNRLRDIRQAELYKDLRSKVENYKNRYGNNNMYLSVIENLILEEDSLQESFGEYEQIINTLLSTHIASRAISFELKKALLISLYQSEKMSKKELVKEIKQDLAEAAQYEDLSTDLQTLQTELM